MSPDPTNPQRSIATGPDGDVASAHHEWALQADAARIAGCSASAIRKWRREGVIEDRRTTTTGGLERVEVRLADVMDRAGREPSRPVATEEIRQVVAAHPGTVVIPLSDLQAMILSLAEAERRTREASSQMTEIDTGTQQLATSLANTEADLLAATSEVERLRRRVRELEVAAASGSHRAGAGLENERLREQVTKLEARMAEARSEVDGQRRRIRELEARKASPSQATAAKTEHDRRREQHRALEHRLTSAHEELEGHRRRIRDLEARLAAPSDSEIATDAENERLYKQMARLEARLADSGNEVVALRRRLLELESIPTGPSESESTVEAENAGLREENAGLREEGAGLREEGAGLREEGAGLREEVAMSDTRLARARSELDGQRRRIRELESSLLDRASEVSVPAPRQPLDGPYDAEQELAMSSALSGHPSGSEQAAMASPVTPAVRRIEEHNIEPVGLPPAEEPDLDATADRLRILYHRLHGRPRRDAPTPDEQRQWIADLAAYDEALVVACIEFGVPTSFEPGHRLPAAVRVALTRALREIGLDVAS